MTDRPELRNPRVTVTFDDGAQVEAQTLNPDFISWDLTAAAQHWPPAERAPILFLSYLAFCALRREGAIPDMTWETFKGRAWEVRTVDVDGDQGAPVMDPTLEGPGVDS